ncbi:MarR family winged helix-turn-helix transcriptional regulator [Flavisphingomonas formosensis]|uniref:MarR family winged helix-turn-helix transcriptional regulator n=1 Tax=Flavisphingomonas formosensis TaxID=861534 RepID=UPI0012FA786C|nr:MarR family transcriptional regulator [Sphingomonas formosensis]
MAIREKHDGKLAGRMDVRVWLRLLSCSTIIEKRLRRRFADRYDTTLPRFDVLATLERHPDGVTMGELSRALLVSNGNVTALVRQLEGAGLVSTRSPEGDRRSSIVALTAEGRSHFAELAAAHHAWIKGMFAGVPNADLRALFDLLATVKASIAAEDSEADETDEANETGGAGGRERE